MLSYLLLPSHTSCSPPSNFCEHREFAHTTSSVRHVVGTKWIMMLVCVQHGCYVHKWKGASVDFFREWNSALAVPTTPHHSIPISFHLPSYHCSCQRQGVEDKYMGDRVRCSVLLKHQPLILGVWSYKSLVTTSDVDPCGRQVTTIAGGLPLGVSRIPDLQKREQNKMVLSSY